MFKDKYLSRNQKIIPKKCNKHFIFPNNGQTSPSELCRKGQICSIFKIQLFLDPFKTNISQHIKRSQPRSVLKHVLLPRKGPEISQFWILYSLNPLCSNLRACLAIFLKYRSTKDTFGRFLGVNFDFWSDIYP